MAESIPFGAQVSVIIPTYNEAATVAEIIAGVRRGLQDRPHEVIVVDDDSPDGTWQVADRIAAETCGVKVLRRLGERGLASAVLDGMAAASGQAVAVIDGDLQHDPSVLPEMVSCVLEGGVDLCVATRNSRGGDPGERALLRRWATAAGTAVARLVVPELRRVTDPLSGYFVVRRSHCKRIAEAPDECFRSYKVLWLLLARSAEMRISEIGFTFRPREAGRSKLSLRVMLDDLTVGLSLRLGSAWPVRRTRSWLRAAASTLGVSAGVAVLAGCRCQAHRRRMRRGGSS